MRWTRHKAILVEPVPFAIMREGTGIEHSSRFMGGRFKSIELYYVYRSWYATARLVLGLKPDGNIPIERISIFYPMNEEPVLKDFGLSEEIDKAKNSLAYQSKHETTYKSARSSVGRAPDF